jgi:hypothetical protein
MSVQRTVNDTAGPFSTAVAVTLVATGASAITAEHVAAETEQKRGYTVCSNGYITADASCKEDAASSSAQLKLLRCEDKECKMQSVSDAVKRQ